MDFSLVAEEALNSDLRVSYIFLGGILGPILGFPYSGIYRFGFEGLGFRALGFPGPAPSDPAP